MAIHKASEKGEEVSVTASPLQSRHTTLVESAMLLTYTIRSRPMLWQNNVSKSESIEMQNITEHVKRLSYYRYGNILNGPHFEGTRCLFFFIFQSDLRYLKKIKVDYKASKWHMVNHALKRARKTKGKSHSSITMIRPPHLSLNKQ